MGRVPQVARSASPPLPGQQDVDGALLGRDPHQGSRRIAAQFDFEGLEAIAERLADPVARRVIEMIKEEGVLAAPIPASWLNAAEVAELLQVTREWVYQHADELGAVRLGGGRRPRLRFRREGLAARDGASLGRVEKRPKHRETRSYGLIPIDDSA
jgi:hypothetical protein